jgi:predicted Zn-dependent protease
MLTREQAADLFDRIRRYSSADEVEAIFTGSRFALTRFANNVIHQNVEEENSIVSIRTNFAGRTARATTNQFDDESLRRAVAASENLARVQDPDPDLLPMPDAQESLGKTGEAPVAPPSRFFEQTAAITPADRAEVVKSIVSIACKHKLTTAGIYSASDSREGIFNSRGLANWHHQTLAEVSITMLADDSSGWQKLNSPDVNNLDPVRLAETAAQKAVESAASAGDCAREVHGNSGAGRCPRHCWLHVLGLQRRGDSRPALVSKRPHRHPDCLARTSVSPTTPRIHCRRVSPFDGEGMRRQRVQLVENGVVKRVVYARATARKMKNSEYAGKVGLIEPTGHGFPLPNEMGEMPLNIVFDVE